MSTMLVVAINAGGGVVVVAVDAGGGGVVVAVNAGGGRWKERGKT